MKFLSTLIPDVVEVVIEPYQDDRGWLGVAFESTTFMSSRLPPAWVSTKHLYSRFGAMRGLHWQDPPHAQGKLIACHHGEVYDVAVDLRRDSPTYLTWVGVTLSPVKKNMLYVPPGCAHGMLTVSEESMCSYSVAFSGHHPESERGARWDDAAIGINWPVDPVLVSDRDMSWEPLA